MGTTFRLPQNVSDPILDIFMPCTAHWLGLWPDRSHRGGRERHALHVWNRNVDRANTGAGRHVITNTGMGDTSIAFKYRPIIQDPDGDGPR